MLGNSKIFEKLVNNRLAKHFEKFDYLFDFQNDSWACARLTTDPLTAVTDTIYLIYNISGANPEIALAT